MPNEIQELLPRLLPVPKHTQHAARDRRAPDFLHSPHDHAHVFTLDDDGYPLWADGLVEGQSHLLGESLLYLQSTGKRLCDAGQFREADDEAVGDVPDVDLALEGDEVVFAEGGDLDVPYNDHFVVVFVKDCVCDDVWREGIARVVVAVKRRG